MNWKKILCIAGAVSMLVLAGCTLFGNAPADIEPAAGALATAKSTVASVKGVNFSVLDVIATLAALGAAATLVMLGFGLPVPPKLTVCLVVLTVGAWVLKAILVQYFWIILVLSLIAIVLAGAVVAYTHIGWAEKRLNKDLNKNGQIGN